MADNYRSRDGRRVWDKPRFDKLASEVRLTFGVDAIRVDSVEHRALKFLGEKHKIWVSIDQKTRHLGELSEIVRGMPDQIWRGRIYSDRNQREEVKSFCDLWLEDKPMQGSGNGRTIAK